MVTALGLPKAFLKNWHLVKSDFPRWKVADICCATKKPRQSHNRGVFRYEENERLHEQSIHPFHISSRVRRQAAFGQQGLVEQDVGQVVEVHAAVQLFDQGVVGVDL